MTAHAMAGDEQKSFDAGMSGHVTKPIDPDQLFATLQKWIKPVAERTVVQKAPVRDVPAETNQAKPVEDFDLDGILKLANESSSYEGSGNVPAQGLELESKLSGRGRIRDPARMNPLGH